jgi:hypothetical protein
VQARVHLTKKIIRRAVKKMATTNAASSSASVQRRGKSTSEGCRKSLEELPACALTIAPFEKAPRTNMRTAKLTTNAQLLQFTLCKKGEYACIPFEPSVYRGTGEEDRKDIVFELSAEQAEKLKQFELAVRALIEESYNWNSAVKESEKYGAHLKVKVNVAGRYKALLFDERAERMDFPDKLRGRLANPIVTVRGVYVVNGAAGLQLDLSYMQLKDDDKPEDCNPFL